MSNLFKFVISVIFVFGLAVTVLFSGRTHDAQAAATYVGAGPMTKTANGNINAVHVPNGINENDILITVLHSRDNVVSTMPPDWTLVRAGNGNTTNRLSIWWKRTTGTETRPAITHPGGDSAIARMYAFRGINTRNSPFDAIGEIQSNTGSPITTAGVTTTTNGSMILHIMGSEDNNDWGTFTGIPTNDTNTQANSIGNDDSIDLTYGIQTTAGFTSSASATQTARGPDASVSVILALKPLLVTTITSSTTQQSISARPGDASILADNFTLTTNGETDTITSVTINLGTNAYQGIGLVEITNIAGTQVFGSLTNPASSTIAVPVNNITVDTTPTSYTIHITPRSHASMPPPPGTQYVVSAKVTTLTGLNPVNGTDVSDTVITIDNASPANVTNGTGTAGDTQVTLAWTNPSTSDLDSIVVVRTGNNQASSTPVEGTTYTTGTNIGSSTIACVALPTTTSCVDTNLTNETSYHYNIFTKDRNGNYSTGITPSGSPFTPSLTTFSIISSVAQNGTIDPLGTTTIAQGSQQTYSIIPNNNYDVATLNIDGNLVATSTLYTFNNVQANHTIHATFATGTPQYHIIASINGNGGISPSGDTLVSRGNTQTYLITADSGYKISALQIDGGDVVVASTYTFTNVQSSHTIHAIFELDQTASGRVSAPSSYPTTVGFTGTAFPYAKISLVDKQINLGKQVNKETTADANGIFTISFAGIFQSLHSFAVVARDDNGHVSQSKFFFINTISDTLTSKSIILPPTIEISKQTISRGSNVSITGLASPSCSVELEIDGTIIRKVAPSADGTYAFEISTGTLEFGDHTARVRQINTNNKQSDFSISKTITISKLSFTQADLNNDKTINIRDWSIFLSLWATKNILPQDRIDLNHDGKVDIIDFSIFIKTVRNSQP